MNVLICKFANHGKNYLQEVITFEFGMSNHELYLGG